MSDFPEGKWDLMLVGHQWPYDTAVEVMGIGKNNRGSIEIGYSHLADNLFAARTGALPEQEGRTADDMREKLHQGEDHARGLAAKNGVKKDAYNTARNNAESLQSELRELAAQGNKQIDDIQASKEPAETKLGKIVGVVADCQRQANQSAAKYGANIIEAIQRVLDEEGTGQSAYEFAKAHAIDLQQLYPQPDQKAIEQQVTGMLDNAGSAANPASAFGGANQAAPAPAPAAPSAPDNPASALGGANQAAPAPLPAAHSAFGNRTSTFGSANQYERVPPAPAPRLPNPSTPSASLPTAPAAPSLPSAPSLPNAPTSLPAAPLAGAAGPAQGLTPAGLMQSFGQGLQAGTPVPLAADAVPPATMAPVTPAEAQVPPSAPTTPMAGAGGAVHAPAFDTPAAVEHAPAAQSPPPAPLVTGPAAPASLAPTPPPAGPLPAYGADLRPPVSAASTPSAPLSSPPPPAAPASAPTHSAAGQASVGQPAVVRQAPPPPPSQSPPGLGTQAVMATAGGGLAGAVSADATARARLQRLVDFVARQEPRLAWAAGDRPDDTTVLVTDLASGWIPPGIDLPAAVTLLEPRRRRGDLVALLGEVSVAASYTPFHYLPAEEGEPVPASPRARRAPQIEELGWQLSRATHWRDGLPRIAHTLAVAASRGTGVLESEVDELRNHLKEVTARVLDAYPDHVDPNELGNWQLLAAIDALAVGANSGANYHLAWFLALTATAGARR
jgi:hypothetical protein